MSNNQLVQHQVLHLMVLDAVLLEHWTAMHGGQYSFVPCAGHFASCAVWHAQQASSGHIVVLWKACQRQLVMRRDSRDAGGCQPLPSQ
jgi:hypothetical protein